jgi:hypothetical protein
MENVGKTVLYKISYFSDFDYYELYEEKLAGNHIVNYHMASLSHFEEVTEELENEVKLYNLAQIWNI